MPKVLVVDDELSIRESFNLILEGKYKVITAASGEGALKQIADQNIDLAYLDIRMPGMDGIETLKKIKSLDPELEVVMVTAVNEVQKASEAIKIGARDYIVKPFDIEDILKMTEQILRRKSLSREVERESGGEGLHLVGQNEKIVGINRLIDKIAPKDLRVLVLGEAGTEKELIARIIHARSPRADFPFNLLNLSPGFSTAGIAQRLIGKGKGSTVADLEKGSGLLETTRGGTLFINNVELLPPLLDSLPGSNVRLVAASALPNLEERTKDKYDYFSEVLIQLPPLRERISDLPLLISHLLEQLNRKYAKEIKGIAPEVENIFSNYDWPGNMDELSALLEALVVRSSSGEIGADDLPVDLLLKSSQAYGGNYLSLFENEFIHKVKQSCEGDERKAAAVLGVNPQILNSL